MKLLLDQNLSRKIVEGIATAFPGSVHVLSLGMETATDATILEYAREGGYTIATKDADFRQLALVRGAPPKVILLLLGNCSTTEAVRAIVLNAVRIRAFGEEPETALLVLTR